MWKLLLPGALIAPGCAQASEALGGEIYGAEIERGLTEVELRYDALGGGASDGADLIKFELDHGLTDRLQIGLQADFAREPGAARETRRIGVEAVYRLGAVGPVDVALYGEYALGIGQGDSIEAKLLLQHESQAIDVRVNLIAERELEDAEPVELGYAAQVTTPVAPMLRLGAQGFGGLGTFDRFTPRADHYLGPVLQLELELDGLGKEFELQAGYLVALGAARDETRGVLRLALGMTF